MMNRKRRLILQAGVLAFIPILTTLAPQSVQAQAQARPILRRGGGSSNVPGELLLYCQPHTPDADVKALAAIVGAQQTIPLLLADAYKLVLPAGQQTDAATANAVAALKVDPRVRWVNANVRRQYFQTGTTTLTPNDKRYGEQWNLKQINMPQAWALQKGTANVADIDTGTDLTIADLTNQFLPDSYNVADGNTNITAGPYTTTYQDAQHGVGTSGVMIAQTNNAVGIASVCGWGTTKCLFLKDAPGVTDGGSLDIDVNALAYILAHQAKDNVVAINISWGYPTIDPTDTTNILYAAVKACTDAGIITCVSSGNEAAADTLTMSPQGYPFVVTVGATGPNAKLAFYSSYGKVDVVAPGGDPTLGGTPDPDTGATFGATTDSVLTTWDGDYHYVQGTSFAAPHVAAVVTLLRSVPGVTSREVFDPANRSGSVLLNTANHSITGQGQVPDPKYGFGIVDAYAALQQVSTNVTILNPIGINPTTGQSSDPLGLPPSPIETLRPSFNFEVRNIPLSNINIVLQQTTGNIPIITGGQVDPASASHVTNFQVTGTTTGAFPLYEISFRYRFDTTLPSLQQTIVITGQPADATRPAVSDSRVFTIAPHQFQSGLSMVSIPYYESSQDSPAGRLRSPQELLGLTSLTIYRWTNVAVVDSTTHQSVVRGTYAANSTDPSLNAYPDRATLQPTDQPTTLVPDNGIPNAGPLGVGYFLSIPSGALVRTYGQAYTQNLVRIPLHEGWNMVGDPFPFPVSFAASEIETPDGNRYAISDAAQQNLVLPFIYRYVSGSYQLQQLPNGTYEAWESHWIYVVPKNVSNFNPNNVMTLLIPPTASASGGATRAVKGRAASTVNAGVTGPGSWKLRLTARSKDLTDSYNYIGMSGNATDGNDLTKAPKPPMMSPYVSLGISRAGVGAGIYAQDLRPIGGTKTWDVVVNTDQKDADITVQWPNIAGVPKRYHLTLTDQTTGQIYDMRALPAYQFHATAAAPTRKLTITAEPALGGGRAVISNLLVNQANGRGVGQTIYDINYSLSRSASVEVTVLGPNGRVVGHVQPSRAAAAGNNHAYWDGRDAAGRTLSGGTYVLQVRAQTPDGQVTRQIQTMTITR